MYDPFVREMKEEFIMTRFVTNRKIARNLEIGTELTSANGNIRIVDTWHHGYKYVNLDYDDNGNELESDVYCATYVDMIGYEIIR